MSQLDLHGYTAAEAVDLFLRFYNSRVGKGDLSRFRVVHGYGSGGTGGRIRTLLRKLLTASEESLTFEYDPYNEGVTVVVPGKRLPEGAGIIWAEILEFCQAGKSESKILGKFRNYGDLNVKRTLQKLVKQGKLSCSRKGKHSIYSS